MEDKQTNDCKNCKYYFESDDITVDDYQECELLYVETRQFSISKPFSCSLYEPK